MDKDYKLLWEESVKENKNLKSENDCFRQGIESKTKRIDELKGDIEALNDDITNIANEKYDLEIKVTTITNENKKLKENLEFERSMYSSLKNEYKKLETELKKEILELKKIVKYLSGYL